MSVLTKPLVVLVGPPGAGKTTVAGILAARLQVDVRDTDADIVESEGSDVADIFVDRGEPAFRELETRAVQRALDEHAGVLALGGGAVLHDDTRKALHGHRVVFLDVGLSQAASRVGLNSSRPLLLGNVRSQVKALLDARRPVYVGVATHVVLTDGLAPEQVAERIIELLDAGATGAGEDVRPTHETEPTDGEHP